MRISIGFGLLLTLAASMRAPAGAVAGTVGACCLPDGSCETGHDEASCLVLSGAFQGVGTDCQPNCCPQPVPTGSDNCESVTVHPISVPQVGTCNDAAPNPGATCINDGDCGGFICDRTTVVTITGDNSTASNDAGNPDSCSSAWMPDGDLGWYEAFSIDDCAYVTVDFCCSDPLHTQINRTLFDSCPCGDPIFEFRDIYADVPPPPYGSPYCDEDNGYVSFGPLAPGTYYYPVPSLPGGDVGAYQLHLNVTACPDAACCVGGDCQIMGELECAAAGGVFLGYPNQSQPTWSCGSAGDVCATGSCCTGPAECVDNQDATQQSQIDVDQAWCDAEGGDYVGGRRCQGGICDGGARAGQSCASDDNCAPGGVCATDGSSTWLRPRTCPLCGIEDSDNCQIFDDREYGGSAFISDPSSTGRRIVADDFRPTSDTITSICVWGIYSNPNWDANDFSLAKDCGDDATDAFRVRVYGSDALGLPDTSHVIADKLVPNERVTKTYVADTAMEQVYDIRVFGHTLDLSDSPITGLDASGDTCYWLEMTNDTSDASGDGCAWMWSANGRYGGNWFAASGYEDPDFGPVYGAASPLLENFAFCLDAGLRSVSCAHGVGSCCYCDGTCQTMGFLDCRASGGRWSPTDSCDSGACPAAPPANDNCADVVDASVAPITQGIVSFDSSCASADGVNPVTSDDGSEFDIPQDVWFKYVAEADGVLRVSTCPSDPVRVTCLDAMVAAYRNPNDSTTCVCPSDAASQDAAVAWYTEPTLPSGPAHVGDSNCDNCYFNPGGFVRGHVKKGDCILIRAANWLHGDVVDEVGSLQVSLVQTPPAPIAVDATNRYLLESVPAGPGGAQVEDVLRVRVVALPDATPIPQEYLYVAAPFAAPDENASAPGLTFTAARLTCQPVAHAWATEGTIAITGAEIQPGGTYELQRAPADCPLGLDDAACWSPVVTMATRKFGDVAEPLQGGGSTQPDFTDIAKVVMKFMGDPAAPAKAYVQLVPNIVHPDRPIDFNDIAADVSAFLGTPFSDLGEITGPCTCPSTVVCGATACVADGPCGGGTCIDGFCTDPCGRCTN